MTPRALHRLLPAVGLAVAVLAGGCGVGAGEKASSVDLTVTDDFGRITIAQDDSPQQQGSDTVMRLLQRNAKVDTRYGGGFVQAIDGLRGKAGSGGQIDWFFYVNGVLADRGAASWRLRPGERVWWDRHRWDYAQVEAVVGSFPEPLRSGHDGRFAGAALDCRADAATCARATEVLTDAGVKVSVGDAAPADATRVVIGPWPAIRGAASELEDLPRGARRSGVFAQLAPDGTPTPQRADGSAGAPLAGAALVAAMRVGDASPVWVVTGADEQAVARGVAEGLSSDALRGHLAVLVPPTGETTLALPVADSGAEQP